MNGANFRMLMAQVAYVGFFASLGSWLPLLFMAGFWTILAIRGNR